MRSFSIGLSIAILLSAIWGGSLLFELLFSNEGLIANSLSLIFVLFSIIVFLSIRFSLEHRIMTVASSILGVIVLVESTICYLHPERYMESWDRLLAYSILIAGFGLYALNFKKSRVLAWLSLFSAIVLHSIVYFGASGEITYWLNVIFCTLLTITTLVAFFKKA